MKPHTKGNWEHRAVAGLVVVFTFTLVGALRSAGVLGRPAAMRRVPAVTVTAPSPPHPVTVQDARTRVDAQLASLEQAGALPASESATSLTPPTYAAQDLRDPLRSLLPEAPAPQPVDAALAMVEQPLPTAPAPSLVVQGIWWGGAEPKAIINNDVYGVGDLVEGARITAIGRTGVTVEFGGETLRVAPSQEPTSHSLSRPPAWR